MARKDPVKAPITDAWGAGEEQNKWDVCFNPISNPEDPAVEAAAVEEDKFGKLEFIAKVTGRLVLVGVISELISLPGCPFESSLLIESKNVM